MGEVVESARGIREALETADLRVLLMSLHHMTGDDRWLMAPYLPRKDVRIIADESAGLAAEVADEVRAAAAEVWGAEPAINVPDDERMARMMAVCLGHGIPREYLGMMKEEMGFASRDVVVDSSVDDLSEFDA